MRCISSIVIHKVVLSFVFACARRCSFCSSLSCTKAVLTISPSILLVSVLLTTFHIIRMPRSQFQTPMETPAVRMLLLHHLLPLHSSPTCCSSSFRYVASQQRRLVWRKVISSQEGWTCLSISKPRTLCFFVCLFLGILHGWLQVVQLPSLQ